MQSPSASILNELRSAAADMRGDFSDMAAVRWELARLELADSQQRVTQLARVLIACATFIVVAASVLVAVAVVRWHDQIGDGPLAAGAAVVVVVALLIGFVSYRHFRRDFTGLSESIAELREDAVWLEELLGTGRKL